MSHRLFSRQQKHRDGCIEVGTWKDLVVRLLEILFSHVIHILDSPTFRLDRKSLMTVNVTNAQCSCDATRERFASGPTYPKNKIPWQYLCSRIGNYMKCIGDPQIESCQRPDFNPDLGIALLASSACGDNLPTGCGCLLRINK